MRSNARYQIDMEKTNEIRPKFGHYTTEPIWMTIGSKYNPFQLAKRNLHVSCFIYATQKQSIRHSEKSEFIKLWTTNRCEKGKYSKVNSLSSNWNAPANWYAEWNACRANNKILLHESRTKLTDLAVKTARIEQSFVAVHMWCLDVALAHVHSAAMYPTADFVRLTHMQCHLEHSGAPRSRSNAAAGRRLKYHLTGAADRRPERKHSVAVVRDTVKACHLACERSGGWGIGVLGPNMYGCWPRALDGCRQMSDGWILYVAVKTN